MYALGPYAGLQFLVMVAIFLVAAVIFQLQGFLIVAVASEEQHSSRAMAWTQPGLWAWHLAAGEG